MKKLKLVLNVFRRIKNFPLYFLDYFGLLKSRNTFVHEFWDGTRIKVRTKQVEGVYDMRVVNEVFLYKIYSPKGFEIFPSDTVIDIGGHIGTFTIYAGRQAKKVYTFEPMDFNLEILKSNIALNDLKNVEVIEKAIAKKEGKQKIYVAYKNHGSNSFIKEWSGENRVSREIETLNLPKFIKEKGLEKIDFLKMDCEGAEYEIFESLDDVTWKKIKKIVMETHDLDDKRNIGWVVKFLKEKGFRVKFERGGSCGIVWAIRERR